MVENVETIQKLHTWDHGGAFFLCFVFMSIITITFETGQREDSRFELLDHHKVHTCVEDETEEALRTVCLTLVGPNSREETGL